jgi:hypothetical protein
LVLVAGVLLSDLSYSEWFKACCNDASPGILIVLDIVLGPAILFAILVGGVHSATQTHVTVGIVVELLVIWGLGHTLHQLWLRWRKARANRIT